MLPKILSYQTPLRQNIEVILAQLEQQPENLSLHQSLREASLEYCANGGKPLGFFSSIRIVAMTPLKRLLYYSRLWAFDPGNPYILNKLALAVLDCEYSSAGFQPVRDWLEGLMTKSKSRL